MRWTRNVLVTVFECGSPHQNGLQMQMLVGRQKPPQDPRISIFVHIELCGWEWKPERRQNRADAATLTGRLNANVIPMLRQNVFTAWCRFNLFCPAKSSGHVETRTVRLDKNGLTGVLQTITQQPMIFSYTNGPTQNVPDSFRRLKRWKVSVGNKTTTCTHTEKRLKNGAAASTLASKM